MPQGPPKKRSPTAGAAFTARSHKPQRRSANKQGGSGKDQKLKKKLTGQGINVIERIMAARAAATGKLTIMKRVANEGAKAQEMRKKGGRTTTSAAQKKINKKKNKSSSKKK